MYGGNGLASETSAVKGGVYNVDTIPASGMFHTAHNWSQKTSQCGRGEHGAEVQVATPIPKGRRGQQEVENTSLMHNAAPEPDKQHHLQGKKRRGTQLTKVCPQG